MAHGWGNHPQQHHANRSLPRHCKPLPDPPRRASTLATTTNPQARTHATLHHGTNRRVYSPEAPPSLSLLTLVDRALLQPRRLGLLRLPSSHSRPLRGAGPAIPLRSADASPLAAQGMEERNYRAGCRGKRDKGSPGREEGKLVDGSSAQVPARRQRTGRGGDGVGAHSGEIAGGGQDGEAGSRQRVTARGNSGARTWNSKAT